jgi:hypothetical protein
MRILFRRSVGGNEQIRQIGFETPVIQRPYAEGIMGDSKVMAFFMSCTG